MKKNESPNLLIGSFATKATPVLNIHFTRKNLLLGAGPMEIGQKSLYMYYIKQQSSRGVESVCQHELNDDLVKIC
ncbi:hypothetical protein MAR_034657 [Mya arenaria]|uniref:Uncharacterized protein n=1 Tax=Mya arenaria TaxID=6604 RepID=A0ABY7EQX3_MYAAR|nr:hypothetical protein MAR_034657 [Mya arenaria]